MTAPGFIYAIAAPGSDRVKIGFAGDPRLRLAQLLTASPDDLAIIGVVPGSKGDEACVHRRFRHLQIRREWFWHREDVAAFVDDLAKQRALHLGPDRSARRPDSPLQRYLKAQKIRDAEFADAIGVSAQAVSRYALGLRRPEWSVLERIRDATDGALMPNDFLFVDGHEVRA